MSGWKLVSADTAFLSKEYPSSARDSQMSRHVTCRQGLRCRTCSWRPPGSPVKPFFFFSCCSLVVKPGSTTASPLFPPVGTWVRAVKVRADSGGKPIPPVTSWVHCRSLPAEQLSVCWGINHKPWRCSWHLLKCNLRCMSALIKWKLYRRRFGPWLFQKHR